MKIICVYHANCSDGFAAAWVIKNHFKTDERQLEFYPCNYNEDYSHLPAIVEGNQVYVVDFSFPREFMTQLHKVAYSLLVLDHHKTAQAACADLEFCHFDMTRSGAMLAWNEFHEHTPDNLAPALIQYVQDRDLWQWKLPASKEVNAAIGSYERTFENYDMLHNMLCSIPDAHKIVEQGSTILRIQQGQILNTIDTKKLIPMTIGGYKVDVINNPNLISECVGELAKIEGVPFAAAFFMRPDGMCVFSLRSSDNGIDVSAIACQYGGGGHPHAAGFSVGLLQVQDFLLPNL